MEALSEALRERLGGRAARDLEEFTDANRARWSEDVLHPASDRFENRLTAEMAAFRLEMQSGFGDLRVEVLRWSFLFWIGQIAAIAGLLAFMLNMGPR